jgi:hypothetical protein
VKVSAARASFPPPASKRRSPLRCLNSNVWENITVVSSRTPFYSSLFNGSQNVFNERVVYLTSLCF